MEQNRSVAAEDVLVRLLNQCPDGSYMLPVFKAKEMPSIALFERRKVNQARQVMNEAACLGRA